MSMQCAVRTSPAKSPTGGDLELFQCVVKDKNAFMSLSDWTTLEFSRINGRSTLFFPENFFVNVPGGCFALEIILPARPVYTREVLQVVDVNIRKCTDLEWWRQAWEELHCDPPTNRPAVYQIMAVSVGTPILK